MVSLPGRSPRLSQMRQGGGGPGLGGAESALWTPCTGGVEEGWSQLNRRASGASSGRYGKEGRGLELRRQRALMDAGSLAHRS